MIKTNAFSISYGLIVLTRNKKIVIIQRKIPYCVQDFLMKNKSYNLNNYKEVFETKCFKTLNLNMKFDYFNFFCGSQFEDQFDIPHGQMELNKTKVKRIAMKIKKNSNFSKNELKFYAFITAVREFKEETGYSFQLHDKIVDNIPTKTIEFIGLDNYFYRQTYFILTVDKLERCNIKVDHFYEPLVIDITKAVDLFKKQQKIKCDGKDLILSKLL